MRLLIALVSGFIMLVTYSLSAHAFLLNKYSIKAKITNDNGVPVRDADVYVSFEKNTTSGTKMYAKRGTTDSEGKFEASGSGNGHISYGASKKGYYQSYYTYDFPGMASTGSQKRDFSIVLRKIENPAPMYARNTKLAPIEIPVIGKDVGFDLVKFDWVVPYGRGSESDMIFHLERLPVVTRQNYTAALSIKFSNKYDGIQKHLELRKDGSQFKLPRYAPETGYEQKLDLQESFTTDGPDKLNFNFHAEDLNYIFRIRSVEKDGKLEKSMYGKIRGTIDFSAMRTKTAKIYFYYYLNPDYTRNLEFDPKHNLFGVLPDRERVTEP